MVVLSIAVKNSRIWQNSTILRIKNQHVVHRKNPLKYCKYHLILVFFLQIKLTFEKAFHLLISSNIINAQKEAAIWYFGENAGLDFNSGAPVALTNGALNTMEGCATISNVNGQLLFYTDGTTVWNKNHQVMLNGTGLLGDNDSSQSAIIVPIPQNPNKYYIFTVDKQAGLNGMNYSEVDLTLDGGLGAITNTKNINLMSRSTEKITAVINKNGEDIWVVGHPWRSNAFHSYLITSTGLNTVPVVSSTPLTLEEPPNTNGTNQSVGYMKISPLGNKLGMCNYTLGAYVFDFDNDTGIVSNLVQVSNSGYLYGLEFSPSGKLMYTTEQHSFSTIQSVYQYNLEAADIAASEMIIGQGAGAGFAIQLAIDGKIYGIASNRGFLYSIENPNVLGLGSNFIYESVDLNGRLGLAGLPPFIQSYFTANFKFENTCYGDLTVFSENSGSPVLSAFWDFGDGTTSTLENPSHSYAQTGSYTVNLTLTTNTGIATETKDITISEVPMVNIISSIDECSTATNYELDLTSKNGEILGSQSSTIFKVTYHSTVLDAENGLNELPNLFIRTNTGINETIYARIANKDNSSCFDTTRFGIVVKQAPILNSLVSNWTVCDDDTDGLYNFDLTTKDSEILNGQDAVVFPISYYANQIDANSRTNALTSAYENVSSLQEIFYRIENNVNNECYEIGSFTLEVILGVTANPIPDNSVCDEDNDGIASFDLSINDATILGSQTPSSFSVSYHNTQLDAETSANVLNKTDYGNTTAYTQTIYARVVNTSNADCYATTSFQIIVNDTPITQDVTDWKVCDTDNDGISTFDLTQKDAEILGEQSSTTYSVSYFETEMDAIARANEITTLWNNKTRQQQVFYRLENTENSSCFIIGDFSALVYDLPIANSETPLVACDENKIGIATFDLSLKDTEILGTQNSNDYSVTYFSSENEALSNQKALNKNAYINQQATETMYARVTNVHLEACFALTSFEIILNSLPEIELEETYVICPDSPDLIIDGGAFESWEWKNDTNIVLATTRELAIVTLGTYTLTVTQTANGVICENTATFEVVYSGAPETFSIDTRGFSDQVSLLVNAEGIGAFEYSIDGVNFQNSNEFKVFPGKYTVYVRDAFLFRTITNEIVVIGYQKFFTPNGDSTNDYWSIIGADEYPEATISIYDRYGKMLYLFSVNSIGWDGTYNGRLVPAADYWFVYTYANGKTEKGHFSLKR